MRNSLADQYYLKALDAYPYNLDEAVENLNYALSYDEEHCRANFLMGRFCMEQLKEFDLAEAHFDQAIMSDMAFPDTYKYYSLLKIWKSEFTEASKIIDFGMKVKGMNKCVLLMRRSMIHEFSGELDKALGVIEQAYMYSTDSNTVSYMEGEISRIKKKMRKI